MSYSVVQVCNLALSHIGAAPIAALGEGTAEAIQCALLYAPARDAVLRQHPWCFATRQAVLARLGDGPTGWRHAYAYPADCLRARVLVRPSAGPDPEPFAVALNAAGVRVVLADVAPAELAYTARLTDPTVFDPLFVQALAWRLAADLAPALTGNADLHRRMDAAYAAALSAAWAADAAEGQGTAAADAAWIRARG